MNYVHIIGRLGKDPETRFTADGKKIITLSVATSSFKAGNEETIWWRVTLWGDRWDKMVSYLTKGKPVMVGGEMRKPETYTDKNGALQLSSIEVTADYVKFLPYGKTDQENQQSGQGYAAPQAQKAPAANAFSQGQSFGSSTAQQSEDDEPLPF